MITLLHFDKVWLKFIHVLPGESTSDQSHNERAEIHVKIYPIPSIKKIKIGDRHRMVGGMYVEIAYGRPREEDIIRYSDKYGRS